MKTPFIALMGLSLLSACGGASTGAGINFDSGAVQLPVIDTRTPGIPFYDSASDVATQAISLTNDLEVAGLTAPAAFQRSGSASFSGPIVLNDKSAVAEATVAGGITLGVNFADESKVSALAGNFYDLANTRVDGTLSMRGVEFSEGTAGGGFVGELTGTLSDVGTPGRDNTYRYDMTMAGIYYGPGVEGILMISGGTATMDSETQTFEMSGAATLERE